MATHTITAMFHSRQEADRAAAKLRAESRLGAANVRVLPETGAGGEAAADGSAGRHESTGFMASLRNFFMPEEDRYGYAEGMRRGSVMVAADVDEAHVHPVMDILEESGAVDLDAEEARWRSEGWSGYQPGSAATTDAAAGTTAAGSATIPPTPGAATGTTGGRRADPGIAGSATATPAGTGTATRPGIGETAASRPSAAATGAAASAQQRTTGAPAASTAASTETEERIPIAEEKLRVGKRQVVQGRVRIRSYIVEAPVEETVHLREEHVNVEHRSVDRLITGTDADPFREREVQATETREEPVVSKEARIREELVLRKSAAERDETIRDTVRHTEVREDRGDDPAGTSATRDTGATPKP